MFSNLYLSCSHLFQFLKLIMLAMEPTIVSKMEIHSHPQHYSLSHSPKHGIIFKTRESWSSKSWIYSVFHPQISFLIQLYSEHTLGFFPCILHLASTLQGPWCLVSIMAVASSSSSPLSLVRPTHSGEDSLWVSALLHYPTSTPTKRFMSLCSQEGQIRRDKEEVVKETMSLVSVIYVKGSPLNAYASWHVC